MADDDTIRAVRIARHGGIDELALEELPAPRPGPGELAVRTVASTINPVDWKTRAWDRGPAMPMTLLGPGRRRGRRAFRQAVGRAVRGAGWRLPGG